MDLGTVYKVTCKESDQDHVYIFVYNLHKIWLHKFPYKEIVQD
jgi:hypothetical protein